MGCTNGIAALSGDARVEQIAIRADQMRIPLNVMLELTYRCNVDCVHCYCQHLNEPIKRSELTTDEWKKVLDQLAEMGALYLTLTGGEIFIRKDFWEIANHAKKNHFAIGLFTNGTLIDEKNADKLAELKPFTLEMSLLSPVPQMHDLLAQRKGSYDRIMRATELLRERNVTFLLKTTVFRENVKQVQALAETAQRVGAREFRFGLEMTPKNDGSTTPLAHQVSREQAFDFLSGNIPSPWEVLPDKTQEEMNAKPTCGAAEGGLGINPYGDILPCIQLFIPLGNVKEVSVKEAWANPPSMIEHIRRTNTYGDLPECSDCNLISKCKRCHGIALLETGRWDAKYKTACDTAQLAHDVNEYVKNGYQDHPYKKEAPAPYEADKITLPIVQTGCGCS